MTALRSRREFVVGGCATIAAAALTGCDGGSSAGTVVLPSEPAPVPAGPALIMSEVDSWEALVGTSFTIAGEKGDVVSTLSVVTRADEDANRPADLARHRGFFVFFEMDPARVPEGGKSYRVSHATKGSFDLFLGHPGEVLGKGILHAVLN
ncbi:DUF6916 family protein [Sphingosinithalassobacter sp. LHW66-3]|uniref:DUF6916 family protein n=1 Tax=Sphingosinithalassobacter sp. LHW66-3 TaxID=3424718 RepID=UPI003D6B79E8